MIDIISSFWKLGVLRKYGYDVWRVEQWYLVQKMRRKQKKGCQLRRGEYNYNPSVPCFKFWDIRSICWFSHRGCC
ncbi:hypothetical protein V6N11_070194 [Hibiscus sabdariffa]|uniref:Uncharacterized protein n=1 Tax=Hibiscus sabdariffa TaxID=183260 RepID=A0ABR2QEV3_9ROSI